MRAAHRFADRLVRQQRLSRVTRVEVHLFGSLALTGHGHGTDRALMLGLEGAAPETVEPDHLERRVAEISAHKRLNLNARYEIAFDPQTDLVLHKQEVLPYHVNGLRFQAYEAGSLLGQRTYYSIGGGFVVDEDQAAEDHLTADSTSVPYPFRSGAELLAAAQSDQCRISDVQMANELARRSSEEVRAGLAEIWRAMQSCVRRGCEQEGVLPGGLSVPRRASQLHEQLSRQLERSLGDPLTIVDWVNLYALAVNEENAAGGRVVTAPTNGAAGIVPAVMHYYDRFCPSASEDGIARFLLTAGAIGVLYKENASISGAEVGCQGEVGVACSMAAAGLAEVLGGTPEQVENAAEIGMEHNLGLTCDPVKGLVQIPCIERNAMGSIKAINAARMALRGDGAHHISLDKVIRTMRNTGRDMHARYKETSQGGLAVSVTEC